MLERNNKNNIWKLELSKATSYAQKLGWEVAFSAFNNSSFFIHKNNKKLIQVYSKLSPKVKYYVFLHELGHAANSENLFYEFHSENVRSKNSLTYKVLRIKEEIDAWDKGAKLARANNWRLDKDYYTVQAKYLRTYFKTIKG